MTSGKGRVIEFILRAMFHAESLHDLFRRAVQLGGKTAYGFERKKGKARFQCNRSCFRSKAVSPEGLVQSPGDFDKRIVEGGNI